MTYIRDRISEYMKKNRIELETVAENADLETETLANMLSGARPMETTDYIQICKALQVHILTFIDFEQGGANHGKKQKKRRKNRKENND